MIGDEPKWLDGIIKSSGARIRLALSLERISACMLRYNGYELRMAGWTL
jgi:hypothetical protein